MPREATPSWDPTAQVPQVKPGREDPGWRARARESPKGEDEPSSETRGSSGGVVAAKRSNEGGARGAGGQEEPGKLCQAVLCPGAARSPFLVGVSHEQVTFPATRKADWRGQHARERCHG